jgi:putative transposase
MIASTKSRRRNAAAAWLYVPKGKHTMFAAAIREAFICPTTTSRSDLAACRRPTPRQMAEAGTFLDDAEADVLAYMAFPAQHRTRLHSTNPLERLNKEVRRRADIVCIFPIEDSIIRLIGAVLLEANDEGQLQHRYMQVEWTTALIQPAIEEEKASLIAPRAA